jgi:hypothetical protein
MYFCNSRLEVIERRERSSGEEADWSPATAKVSPCRAGPFDEWRRPRE